jgi:FxLD family lantipeptide
MSAALATQDLIEDPFALDLRVITDAAPSEVGAACQTDDGCGTTCASACTSNA